MAGAQLAGTGWGTIQDLFGGVAEAGFGGGGSMKRRGARSREVVAEVTVSFVEALRGTERELALQVPGEPSRAIKVRIPAGVRDQGRVRLRGQGQLGGDLVLQVSVEEHPVFSRQEDDLLLTVPVTVGEAMRGAKVQIPTLDGSVALQIPTGVQSGARLRLKGKGVRRGADRGDLIATIQVVLPPASPDLEDAVEVMEQGYPGGLRGHLQL
jgi:curved DNA-binding protein